MHAIPRFRCGVLTISIRNFPTCTTLRLFSRLSYTTRPNFFSVKKPHVIDRRQQSERASENLPRNWKLAKQYHQRLEEISDVQLRLRSRERVTTTANVWMCLHHARCSTGSRGHHAPYHNSFECNCHISSPSTTMEPPTSTKLRSALISASNNNANRASPLKLTLQSHTKRARTKFELRCGNQRGMWQLLRC